MTIIEAINQIDALKPNAFIQNDKIRWLNTVDGFIKAEVIDTHEGSENVSFTGYDMDTALDTVLLVPAPYDVLYLRWLEAQIDYANAELGKYNNSITMFNSAYADFRNYYNRKNMPKGTKIKYFGASSSKDPLDSAMMGAMTRSEDSE